MFTIINGRGNGDYINVTAFDVFFLGGVADVGGFGQFLGGQFQCAVDTLMQCGNARGVDVEANSVDFLTEFHRERTYFPRLALVQLQWGNNNVLIDPLAVDPRGLGDLLRGPGLALLHASQQDLEVMSYAVGEVPSRMFDTQLAAGFIGYSTPSLAALVQSQ